MLICRIIIDESPTDRELYQKLQVCDFTMEKLEFPEELQDATLDWTYPDFWQIPSSRNSLGEAEYPITNPKTVLPNLSTGKSQGFLNDGSRWWTEHDSLHNIEKFFSKETLFKLHVSINENDQVVGLSNCSILMSLMARLLIKWLLP